MTAPISGEKGGGRGDLDTNETLAAGTHQHAPQGHTWEATPFKIIGQLEALFTFRKAFSLCWQWLHPWRPYGILVVSPLKEQVLGSTSV